MTTKKSKSTGKTTLWGLRTVGWRHPKRLFWDSRTAAQKDAKGFFGPIELVRVTVEPVKKGK